MRPRTDGFDGTLAALAGDADRYFGDPNALLEPVARFERPFSILLRIRVDAAGRRTHAFLKVFKPRHSTPEEIAQLRRFVEREYRAATALHQTVTGRPGLTALRPLALFPEQLAIVTEEVEGKTLDRVLREGVWRRSVRPQVGAAAARVGRWVRTYQGVTAAEGVVSTDGLRAYLDVRLRNLTSVVIAPEERERVLRAFDAVAGRVAPEPLVAIHADLCPANILVGPKGDVTVLDFAMAKSGTRLHDLAHLFMHLEFFGWKSYVPASYVRALQQALLEGYDAGLAENDPLFTLMLLQHVVCHIALLAEQRRGARWPLSRRGIRRRWERCFEMVSLAGLRAESVQG